MCETLSAEPSANTQPESGTQSPESSVLSSQSTDVHTPDSAGAPAESERLMGPGEKALNRAKARFTTENNENSSESQVTNSTPESEQAASGDNPTSDSTPGDDGVKPGEQTTSAISEDSGSQSTNPDSTVTAPGSWPEQWKASFNALPSDGDSRLTLVNMFKDMQAGLTKSFQDLGQEREQLRSLSDMYTRFSSGEDEAKAVLLELADSAGIDVSFDSDASATPPKFETQEEMVQWMLDQNAKTIRKENAKRDKLATQQNLQNLNSQQKADLVNDLRQQFQSGAQQYPDLFNYKDAIVSRLTNVPGLSVTDAYLLERMPGIQQQLSQMASLQQELATLKQTAQRNEQQAGEPAQSDGGSTNQVHGKDANLSVGQRALSRAKNRIAKAANA